MLYGLNDSVLGAFYLTPNHFIKLASNHGKRSLLFQFTSSPGIKQTQLQVSTSSPTSQEGLRKMIPDEGFWDKNVRMKRPMSPHLTIYKFELPSLLSGTHRATGFYLSGVTVAVGASALVLPGDLSSYIDILKAMDLPLWLVAPFKLSLVFPVLYHAINGVRHLTWDTGRGFEMGTLYKTGYFVVGTSLLTSIGIVAHLSGLF